MINKLFDNTISLTIGCIIGICISFVLMKSVTLKSEEAFKEGLRQGRQECIQIIKYGE